MTRGRTHDEMLADIDRDLADAVLAKAAGEDEVRRMCAELGALDEAVEDLLEFRSEVMAARDASAADGRHERIE